MKMEDQLLYIIKIYVDNLLNDLYGDLEIETKMNEDTTNIQKNIDQLESFNYNDYNNILNSILRETELKEKINDTIENYVFDYLK